MSRDGAFWGWLDPRPRHLGRRGLFLLFLALLDGMYGYYLLQSAPPRVPVVLYPFIPQRVWAFIFLGVAAVCLSGILAKYDRWQYAAAAALMAGWAVRYAWLWYRHVPYSWAVLAVWLAFAGVILAISGWPEPVKIEVPEIQVPPL